MNDDQILQGLLSFYKERGIDLSFLLDNPMFKSLSLDAKIRFLKQSAEDIADGTDPSFNKQDLSPMLRDMAIGAGITGTTALGAVMSSDKLFNRNLTMFDYLKPIATAIGVGGGLGILNNLPSLMNGVRNRASTHSYLRTLAKNPSDENAFRVLAHKSVSDSTPSRENPLIKKIIENQNSKAINGVPDEVNKYLEYAVKSRQAN